MQTNTVRIILQSRIQQLRRLFHLLLRRKQQDHQMERRQMLRIQIERAFHVVHRLRYLILERGMQSKIVPRQMIVSVQLVRSAHKKKSTQLSSRRPDHALSDYTLLWRVSTHFTKDSYAKLVCSSRHDLICELIALQCEPIPTYRWHRESKCWFGMSQFNAFLLQYSPSSIWKHRARITRSAPGKRGDQKGGELYVLTLFKWWYAILAAISFGCTWLCISLITSFIMLKARECCPIASKHKACCIQTCASSLENFIARSKDYTTEKIGSERGMRKVWPKVTLCIYF